MIIIYHHQVTEFFNSLQRTTRVKLSRSAFLLEKYGRNLGMPQVKFIQDGLYELRIRGQQEVRVFFVFYRDQVHLLRAFIKRTQKTPKKELEIALKRKNELT